MRTLTHPALVARATRTTIFARVDPDQKLQVIRALRESGRGRRLPRATASTTPRPSTWRTSGISVDNATDVARSAADIILLEPSLAAIGQGVIEGRRTFANTLKYIRMGTSSNFGNMLSMTGAALLLPFLPMTPGQILLNNLIYDASQTAIPTDNVDPDVEAVPARWDVHAIERFMLVFGPISSLFDFATFGLLLLVLGRQREGVPHRLVRGVALHPGPRGARDPDATAARSGGAGPASPLVGRDRRAPSPRPCSSRSARSARSSASRRCRRVFWLLLAAIVAAYLTLVELVKRRFASLM